MQIDAYVSDLLDTIDELGISDNTIFVFTSDNGAMKFSWPDGAKMPAPRSDLDLVMAVHLAGRSPPAIYRFAFAVVGVQRLHHGLCLHRTSG